MALRYADYSDPDEKALAAAALRSGIMPLDKRTLPGERAFAPTSGGITAGGGIFEGNPFLERASLRVGRDVTAEQRDRGRWHRRRKFVLTFTSVRATLVMAAGRRDVRAATLLRAAGTSTDSRRS